MKLSAQFSIPRPVILPFPEGKGRGEGKRGSAAQIMRCSPCLAGSNRGLDFFTGQGTLCGSGGGGRNARRRSKSFSITHAAHTKYRHYCPRGPREDYARGLFA